MMAIYRERWSNGFPTPESREIGVAEWQSGLSGFSGEQIRFAIEECKNPAGPHASWPPSLGEFRGLCLSFQPPKVIAPKPKEIKKSPEESAENFNQCCAAELIKNNSIIWGVVTRMKASNEKRYNRIMEIKDEMEKKLCVAH